MADYKIAMDNLVGREPEKNILLRALNSNDAELIAILGRRRIGKTFLIRSFFKDRLIFEFTGVHEASLQQQLKNFSIALQGAAKIDVPLAVPDSWIEAFHVLEGYITPRLNGEKVVIFFDEFPWIHTPKSGFLMAFDHFWNTWASTQENLIVVICGSAAAWMIRNIVNNRGGLHNRITKRIRLLPFTLYETEQYLKNRGVNIDRYQILQLYMAVGGIPHYLKDVRPGESAAQAIDRLCFTKDGTLKGEFGNLYQSLFDNAAHHISVVRALANKVKGMTRKEIIGACKLSSGGTTTQLLDELVESGFITSYIPFDKRVNDSIYKLSDEYSRFYLKFMEKKRKPGDGNWVTISESPSWKSWSGFAFEGICMAHIPQIKKALGISGVYTMQSMWRHVPGKNEQGAQIDLLIDRRDHTINICEAKYTIEPFAIDKEYATALQQKQRIFREKTKTRKTLFLTMITTFGVKTNMHYIGLVENEVTMDALFEK